MCETDVEPVSSAPNTDLETTRERRRFVLRKLHSLAGAVPLGAFLVLHLWTTAHGMNGREAYERAVAESYDRPLFVVLELVFVYVPLLFHAGYGLQILVSGRPNVRRYPTAKNWGYVMQRVTGVLALAFIVYHAGQFRLPVLLGTMEPTDFFPQLCASLSSTSWGGLPLVAAAYLIGVAACAFHFSNGLVGFCFSWGLTVSEKATRRASTFFGIVGLALFAYGALTVIYFATGAVPTVLGARSADRAVVCERGGTLSPDPSAVDVAEVAR